MRLDKFLQVSRLVKRRTLANELCDRGRVRVNGQRAKATASVKAGDVLTVTSLGRLSVVRILGSLDRRGPAGLARTLYQDLTPQAPTAPGQALNGTGRQSGPRPTKRDRRRLDALRGS